MTVCGLQRRPRKHIDEKEIAQHCAARRANAGGRVRSISSGIFWRSLGTAPNLLPMSREQMASLRRPGRTRIWVVPRRATFVSMVWRDRGNALRRLGVVAAVTGLADSKVDSISVTRSDAPGIGPKLHCRFLFRSLHYERNSGKYLNPGLAKTGMAKTEAKKRPIRHRVHSGGNAGQIRSRRFGGADFQFARSGGL